MGVIAFINDLIDWILEQIAKLKEWILEQIQKAIAEVKKWVLDRIMQITTRMLVDVAEGIADGVEESE